MDPSPFLYTGSYWPKEKRKKGETEAPPDTSDCARHPGCALLLRQCESEPGGSALYDEGALMNCAAQLLSLTAAAVHVHPVYPFQEGEPDLPMLTSTYTLPEIAIGGVSYGAGTSIYGTFKGTSHQQRIEMICHLGKISCRAQEACKNSQGWETEEDLLPDFLQFSQQAPVPCDP